MSVNKAWTTIFKRERPFLSVKDPFPKINQNSAKSQFKREKQVVAGFDIFAFQFGITQSHSWVPKQLAFHSSRLDEVLGLQTDQISGNMCLAVQFLWFSLLRGSEVIRADTDGLTTCFNLKSWQTQWFLTFHSRLCLYYSTGEGLIGQRRQRFKYFFCNTSIPRKKSKKLSDVRTGSRKKENCWTCGCCTLDVIGSKPPSSCRRGW